MHVVSEIVRNVVSTVNFEEAQQLRLVNRQTLSITITEDLVDSRQDYSMTRCSSQSMSLWVRISLEHNVDSPRKHYALLLGEHFKAI